MYKYDYGMYGGKFMPFHKGHLYCLKRALEECEKVYLLLIIHGEDEEKIRKKETAFPKELLTSVDERINFVKRGIQTLPIHEQERIVFKVVDVLECRDKDGKEDWDKETPLVLSACNEGKFHAVYGSEKEYEKYFKKAYPWADYRLVDESRIDTPISATIIRDMKKEEAKKWTFF